VGKDVPAGAGLGQPGPPLPLISSFPPMLRAGVMGVKAGGAEAKECGCGPGGYKAESRDDGLHNLRSWNKEPGQGSGTHT
jgi:hypothetical protein